MRKLTLILLALLTISLVYGCTNNGTAARRMNDAQRMKGRFAANMTDEQRQELAQQREDACQDKSEGDTCISTTPMEEIKGVCTQRNDQLLCMPNRSNFPQ